MGNHKLGFVPHVCPGRQLVHPVVAPGVERDEEYRWGFRYIGTADAVISAGLARPEWIPGTAACTNKHTFTIRVGDRKVSIRRAPQRKYFVWWYFNAKEEETARATHWEQRQRYGDAAGAAPAEVVTSDEDERYCPVISDDDEWPPHVAHNPAIEIGDGSRWHYRATGEALLLAGILDEDEIPGNPACKFRSCVMSWHEEVLFVAARLGKDNRRHVARRRHLANCLQGSKVQGPITSQRYTGAARRKSGRFLFCPRRRLSMPISPELKDALETIGKVIGVVGGTGGIFYWIEAWRSRVHVVGKIVGETAGHSKENAMLRLEVEKSRQKVTSLGSSVLITARGSSRESRAWQVAKYRLNVETTDRPLEPFVPKIIAVRAPVDSMYLFGWFRVYRIPTSVGRDLVLRRIAIGRRDIGFWRFQWLLACHLITGKLPEKDKDDPA